MIGSLPTRHVSMFGGLFDLGFSRNSQLTEKVEVFVVHA